VRAFLERDPQKWGRFYEKTGPPLIEIG